MLIFSVVCGELGRIPVRCVQVYAYLFRGVVISSELRTTLLPRREVSVRIQHPIPSSASSALLC
jgi:hypothetical protein